MSTIDDLTGKRIATSYDVVVRKHLEEKGIDATVVHLDGAVESSVQLGVADAIADVVETGSTLRAAGLTVFAEPLMTSEAVLIRRADAVPEGLEILDRRIQGVLVARGYVLIDYDIHADHLEEAVELTPGLQSPTVSPLHDGEWFAVRAMVKKDDRNKVMDGLYEVGARAILVTPILACRL